MSSGSQATMSESQLAEMLSKLRASRETEALRGRLPAQLAPFASNISITEPTQSTNIAPCDGLHYSSCDFKERTVCMSIAVVLSQHSQSQEPHAKPLKLVWKHWGTSSRYLTGSADSRMHYLSLKYGRSKAKVAFAGWYCDPGVSESKSSHGGVKSVVEEVTRDMGFHGEMDNKLEVLEALLGDDGMKLLMSRHEDPTLRQVIADELEEESHD